MKRLKILFVLVFVTSLALILFLIARTYLRNPKESKETPSSTEVQKNSPLLTKKTTVKTLRAVQSLQELIQLPTVSGSTNSAHRDAFESAVHLLQEKFPQVHQHLELERKNARAYLFRWPGSDTHLEPGLGLAHLDVVPAEGLWTHDPFSGALHTEPTTKEQYIYGRGAIDDKVSVIAWLEAVESLLEQGFTPKRTLLLSFGEDEEIGGAQGAEKIAQSLLTQKTKLAWVLDEGMAVVEDMVPGVAGRIALIGIAEKGYVSFRLEAHGEGGHSSMPRTDTAIKQLSAAIVRIENSPMEAHIDGPASLLFDALETHLPFVERVVMSNRDLFEPLVLRMLEKSPASNALVRTTWVTTIVNAGVKDNVIPSKAVATINVRIHPHDTLSAVETRLKDLIADSKIDLISLQQKHGASPLSQIDDQTFESLKQNIHDIFGEIPIAPTLVLGATDARHFYTVSDHVYRFLPIVITPNERARIHSQDERVSVLNLERAAEFYALWIRRACGN